MTRFPKAERLKSRKTLGQAFATRQSFGAYPLRLIWLQVPKEAQEIALQAAFSVPKKRFKRAVDRHRLQRQMREIYRLHKAALYAYQQTQNQNLALIWLYTGQEMLDYEVLEQKGKYLLKKLLQTLEQADNQATIDNIETT